MCLTLIFSNNVQKSDVTDIGLKLLTPSELSLLGQSPWGMNMCLVWQSVLLGNG